MRTIQGTLESNSTIEEVLNKLRAITIDEQPFIKPKHAFFIGKITGEQFRLITFNAPPVEFDFTIQDGEIHFRYKIESASKSIKALVFALLLPMFSGLWIYVVFISETDNWSKIIMTLALGLPFVLNWFYKFLYERFILAKDEKLLKKLSDKLEIELKTHSS